MQYTLIIATVLSACTSLDLTKVPNQDRATDIVWRDVYQDRLEPPLVSWVRPPNLNCDSGTGFNDEFGTCLWGESYVYRLVRIALRSTEISGTSFAHELLHIHLQDEFGNLDPSHSRAEWQPGGLLDKANTALQENGL